MADGLMAFRHEDVGSRLSRAAINQSLLGFESKCTAVLLTFVDYSYLGPLGNDPSKSCTPSSMSSL